MRMFVFIVGFIFGLYVTYQFVIRQAIDDAIDEALRSADDTEWLKEAMREAGAEPEVRYSLLRGR